MNFRENFQLALRCIRANKMRSFLTMLGIIIGISAVITISTIGNSLRTTIEESITSLTGVNQLYFYLSAYDYEEANKEDPNGQYFQFGDLKKMRKELDEYIDALPVTDGVGSTTYLTEDGTNLSVNVLASSEGYLSLNNVETVAGRDLKMQDGEDNKAVCVVSDIFAKYAFPGETALGKKVIFDVDGEHYELYIIGIYKYDSLKLGDGRKIDDEKKTTTSILVPYEYVMNKLGVPEENRWQYLLRVMGAKGVSSDVVMEKIKSYYQQNVLGPESLWYMEASSLEQELGQINTILNVVTIAISVIAAISLIVGGIGVMNIMLVSVIERTKEIGIRKALGAKNKVIETQFLVEAIMICAIGGIIGILIGIMNGGIIALVVKSIMARNPEYSMISVVVRPSALAILISFVFSSLVGVVFGLYPARRAARLSPIDALRYE